MQKKDENNSARLHAVSRTMQTLEELARSTTGVTVLKLASTLGVGKGIASRLLASLLDHGYVVREAETDRYHLSLKLTSIALRHLQRVGFPGICQPILRKLSQETKELVQLSAVAENHLVVVDGAQAMQGLSIVPFVGTRVPLHATAGGKTWLASLSPEKARAAALRIRLAALTPQTIVSVERLLVELETTRRRGFAVVEGEFLDHVNAIAVPIGQARFGFFVGALAVCAPESRLPRARFSRIAPILKAAAAEIETLWPSDVLVLQDLSVAKTQKKRSHALRAVSRAIGP
jgi:DNA-binding IclR family transcriptional regulator